MHCHCNEQSISKHCTWHVSSSKYRAGILRNYDAMQQITTQNFTHARNLFKKTILAQKKLPVKGSRVQQKRAAQWLWMAAARTLLQHEFFRNTSSETERALTIEEGPLWFKILGPWRLVTHRACHDQGTNSQITWKLLSRHSRSGRSRAKQNRSLACGEQESTASAAGGLNESSPQPICIVE